MDASMNGATMAHIITAFGREGFWPSPKNTNGTYSDSVVEFVLDHDGHNPLIVVELDMANTSARVHFGGRTVEVTSVFDNGSGPSFRSVGHEWSSEFLSVDYMSSTVTVNGRAIRTPHGEARAHTATEIEALKAMIPVKDDEPCYI